MIAENDFLLSPSRKKEWCKKGKNLLFVHKMSEDDG